MLGSHAVKIKFADGKVWYFASTGGSVTRLRVHAATFTPENAEKFAAAQREHASEYDISDIKVVKL